MARSFKQARKSKGGKEGGEKTSTTALNASATAASISAATSSSSAAQPSPSQTPPIMASSSSSSRRPVVPNIAAAGRLLVPAKPNWATAKFEFFTFKNSRKFRPTASEIAIKQENGTLPNKTGEPHQNGVNHFPQRSGHGRQRGRGHKRGADKPELIQSEGIFSQGIGDELRTRGSRNKGFKGFANIFKSKIH